jgi:hypothetical protein
MASAEALAIRPGVELLDPHGRQLIAAARFRQLI